MSVFLELVHAEQPNLVATSSFGVEKQSFTNSFKNKPCRNVPKKLINCQSKNKGCHFDREIVVLIFLKLSELFYPYFVSRAVEETSFHHFTEVDHGSSNSFERPI